MPTFSQKLRLLARVLAVEPLSPERLSAERLPPGAKCLTVKWSATTEDRGCEPVEVDSGIARLVFPVDVLTVSHTQEISVPSSRPPRPAQAEAELLLDYLARHIFDLRWTPVVTTDGSRTFVRPADMRLCPEGVRAGTHDVEAFMAELRRMVAEELREGVPMTDDTEALPPLLEAEIDEQIRRQEEEYGQLCDRLDLHMLAQWAYSRAALAQRQQVPTHAETAAVLGINAALHRIEAGRPEDAKAPLEAARAALTAAPSAQAEPTLCHRNPAPNASQPMVPTPSVTVTIGAAQAKPKPSAWMQPDGRVVPHSTIVSAHMDGGAMLSSLSGYTIPLYAAPPTAQAEPQEPLTDEHISALYVSGWGAYCSRASFIAIFREAERVIRQRGHTQ